MFAIKIDSSRLLHFTMKIKIMLKMYNMKISQHNKFNFSCVLTKL